MKVIIAGGRDFNDYERLKIVCDFTLSNYNNIEVVSGCAKGADELGERYASEKGFKVIKFPAKWEEHGKSAGPIRNKEMAEYSDACILFWDGKSKGTKSMMNLAVRKKLKLRVIYFKTKNPS
jgi:hypothetical protein